MRRTHRPPFASLSLAVIGAAVVWTGGCSSSPGVSPPVTPLSQSLGRQMQAQDSELVGKKFRTLLDFERPTNAVFVQRTVAGTGGGHTGSFGVMASGSATINVSSILFGTALPGDWTLIGALPQRPRRACHDDPAGRRAAGRAQRPPDAGRGVFV
ncbi:MAG: hypothetical protein QM754_17835 [Tepidisphaeraceae bacterium]